MKEWAILAALASTLEEVVANTFGTWGSRLVGALRPTPAWASGSRTSRALRSFTATSVRGAGRSWGCGRTVLVTVGTRNPVTVLTLPFTSEHLPNRVL